MQCSNKHSPYFRSLIYPFFIVLQLKIVKLFVTLIPIPILNGFIYGFHRHLKNVKQTSNPKILTEIHFIEWDLAKSEWWYGTFCCNTPAGYIKCLHLIFFCNNWTFNIYLLHTYHILAFYLARQVICGYLQNSDTATQIWQDPWERVDLDPRVRDLQVFSDR
jgi:hypothetical protein